MNPKVKLNSIRQGDDTTVAHTFHAFVAFHSAQFSGILKLSWLERS